MLALVSLRKELWLRVRLLGIDSSTQAIYATHQPLFHFQREANAAEIIQREGDHSALLKLRMSGVDYPLGERAVQEIKYKGLFK